MLSHLEFKLFLGILFIGTLPVTSLAETIKPFTHQLTVTKQMLKAASINQQITIVSFDAPDLMPGESLLVSTPLPPGVTGIFTSGVGAFQPLGTGAAYMGAFTYRPDGVCTTNQGILSGNDSACKAASNSGTYARGSFIGADQNELTSSFTLNTWLYTGIANAYTTDDLPTLYLVMYWDSTTISPLGWLSRLGITYGVGDEDAYNKWLNGESPNAASSVSVSINPQEAGNITGLNCSSGVCSTTVTNGNNLSITASPNTNYAFQNWSGDCQGAGSTFTFTAINGAKSCTANFIKKTQTKLSVTVKGEGTVSITGDSSFSCTATKSPCEKQFQNAETIQLTVSSASAATIASIPTGCIGSLNMSVNRTCEINFNTTSDTGITPQTPTPSSGSVNVISIPFGGTFPYSNPKVTMSARIDSSSGHQWWDGNPATILKLTGDYNNALSLSSEIDINQVSNQPISMAVVALWSTQTDIASFTGSWYQKTNIAPSLDMGNSTTTSSTWALIPDFSVATLETQLLIPPSKVLPLISEATFDKQYSFLVGAGDITAPKEMQGKANRVVQFFVLYRTTLAGASQAYAYTIALGPTVAVPNDPLTRNLIVNAEYTFDVGNTNNCSDTIKVANTSILTPKTTQAVNGQCIYVGKTAGQTKVYNGSLVYLFTVSAK